MSISRDYLYAKYLGARVKIGEQEGDKGWVVRVRVSDWDEIHMKRCQHPSTISTQKIWGQKLKLWVQEGGKGWEG